MLAFFIYSVKSKSISLSLFTLLYAVTTIPYFWRAFLRTPSTKARSASQRPSKSASSSMKRVSSHASIITLFIDVIVFYVLCNILANDLGGGAEASQEIAARRSDTPQLLSDYYLTHYA